MPENMLSSTKKNLLIYWKDKYVKHIDSLEEKERNFARIFISKDVFVLCVPVCPWQGDMGPGGQDERTVLGLKATDTFTLSYLILQFREFDPTADGHATLWPVGKASLVCRNKTSECI